MRIVKLALISAVVIFGVIFLLSLLIPSQVRVSRAINIDAPADSVMAQIRDLRTWKNWNEMMNNAQYTNVAYGENDFSSDQVKVELLRASKDSVITDWHQTGGRDIHSGFATMTMSGVTVVQWYFDFKLRWYPWEKIGSIIFDKQLGPPMEKSLGNLKKILEKQP
ncbi:hypothetical protein HHL16_09305 [Pseudoflavitalea sp. G-6-1-2]|uniref:SRPBCC family protein n=1 Tax=Pseudoflavitalea sp. G-6-1-2 TaxID=2728841 RepID=UPI00146C8CE7|nr:SRPBCC family protein [Pseudoflavitalea sp. G-6-1-2]NML21069.1 hypothetical protein [Pseudoflavitalea sp. G-6-1-2]